MTIKRTAKPTAKPRKKPQVEPVPPKIAVTPPPSKRRPKGRV